MDSPETFRNTITTTTSTSTATTTSLSESPPAEESPFRSFVNNLSPIKDGRVSHLAQGFLGLNSPPLVFTSPRTSSQCETQFSIRPQISQLEASQGDNGGKSVIDDPDNSKKSASLLPGNVITDTLMDLVIRNDRDTRLCSSSPFIDQYLLDPADVDCVYTVHSVSTDVKQSNDTVESSQSDLTCSKEIISKLLGPIENFEGPLLLLEESKGVDETDEIEGEKTDVGSLSKEWESEKQQCDNSFDQLMQAGLGHRGMHRRCLQFEVAASNAFGNINSSSFPVHTPEDSRAWPTCSELKDFKVSRTMVDVTSNKRNVVQLPEPVTSLIPPRFCGNFPVAGSKPSGIGLHLNSIGNAMPFGRASSTGMELAEGYVQEMESASSICHKVENMNRCWISSNMVGQSSVGTEDERREITAAIVAVSATPESPSTMDPSNLLDYVDHPAGVKCKRELKPKEAGNSKEINQLSPRNKKKKTSVTSDDGGCKRCNCKKSQCLKLYCECFAAGMYCAETCSCRDCYNRRDYEDTVFEARQQIESRNPLAFAPKIVQRATDFPLNNMEDDNVTTPSSARHNRGCNCKKSMCLKKYCECYQANVGCSSTCRCNGCKNAYGKKEDYIAMEHALTKERLSSRVEKISDGTFHNKQEMVTNKTDLFDKHRLSPLTPSLQCSDQGKEAAKFRVLTGKYLPSPECDVTKLPPRAKFAEPPENQVHSFVLPETNEMVGTKSYGWQPRCGNVEIMDQSSMRCDVTKLPPRAKFTESPENPVRSFVLPETNEMMGTKSYGWQPRCGNVEIMDQSSMRCSSMAWAASFPSNTREWTHFPEQAQQSHGTSNLLSGGSLHWRSSPITPMTRLGEIKNLVCPESDGRLVNILKDETPEILKEDSTPIKSVKASSPNQKRVSPPESHRHELESSSSEGLRSGRKFILEAVPVPSFPPLTPCIDSRDTSHENSGSD